MTSATASLETVYGSLQSAWRLDGKRFVLDVTIPANTSAQVILWDARLDDVREGGMPVRDARQRGKDVVVELGSGRYSFVVLARPL